MVKRSPQNLLESKPVKRKLKNGQRDCCKIKRLSHDYERDAINSLIAFAWNVWNALTFVGLVPQSNSFLMRQLESLSMKPHDNSSTMFSSHASLLILIFEECDNFLYAHSCLTNLHLCNKVQAASCSKSTRESQLSFSSAPTSSRCSPSYPSPSKSHGAPDC